MISCRRRDFGILVVCLLVQGQTKPAGDIIVMTSGTFTAAHLELAADFERSTRVTVTTTATSMGVGAESIPSRVQRGEPVDVVIVAADALEDMIKDGRVVAGSRVDLAHSSIGMAVRAGARKPDISTVAALTRALLDAQSVAVSSSVSGNYFTNELFPQLGIADRLKGKVRRIEGERVGAVVARGDAELGFQQISELLPGSGHRRRRSTSARGAASDGVRGGSGRPIEVPDAARAYIRFLASPAASSAVAKSGLELQTRRP